MNKYARIIFFCVAVLLMIGTVMIYSSSAIYAYKNCGGDSLYFVKKHMIFMGIGFAVAFFCMTVPAAFLKDHAKTFLFITVILLIMVVTPGIGSLAGGARRWLRFHNFGFQPSEFAKLAVIVYVADFSRRKKY
ncbi:MAG: FtsW/RodA/SpoVE family cell cycle protein, partial [Candidatus Omnitrophica bacterium]|nr:FtsW/RodA/SpoVE family cell cycle protein [Candidatus Omnitrophota bacterium]